MRVSIVGSRDYPDLARVRDFVARLARKYPGAIVLSGGARGVDATAEQAAQENGLEVISYRPVELAESPDLEKPEFRYTIKAQARGGAAVDFVRHKERDLHAPLFRSWPAAAFCRNFWLAQDGEQIVAFHDGTSRGTLNTIENARSLGKEPWVYLANQ